MRKSGLFNPSTVRASGLEDAPQLKIDINRSAAAAQGISFSDIRTALASSLGSSYVNDFPNQGRLQRVMVQADASARMQPADILNLTVPNKSGVAVPLSTIATVSWENGMEQSVRFNGYPAMELSGSPVNGVSSGQAMAAVQQWWMKWAAVTVWNGVVSLVKRLKAARKLSCCTHWPLPLYSWYWLLCTKAGLSRWRLSL